MVTSFILFFLDILVAAVDVLWPAPPPPRKKTSYVDRSTAPSSIIMPDGTPDVIAQAVANAPALFEQARRAEAVKRQWAATRCGLVSEDERGPCLLDRGHAGDCVDHKGPFGSDLPA